MTEISESVAAEMRERIKALNSKRAHHEEQAADRREEAAAHEGSALKCEKLAGEYADILIARSDRLRAARASTS